MSNSNRAGTCNSYWDWKDAVGLIRWGSSQYLALPDSVISGAGQDMIGQYRTGQACHVRVRSKLIPHSSISIAQYQIKRHVLYSAVMSVLFTMTYTYIPEPYQNHNSPSALHLSPSLSRLIYIHTIPALLPQVYLPTRSSTYLPTYPLFLLYRIFTHVYRPIVAIQILNSRSSFRSTDM